VAGVDGPQPFFSETIVGGIIQRDDGGRVGEQDHRLTRLQPEKGRFILSGLAGRVFNGPMWPPAPCWKWCLYILGDSELAAQAIR